MKLSTATKRLMIECGMKYIARHGCMAFFWSMCLVFAVIFAIGEMFYISDGYEQHPFKLAYIAALLLYSAHRTIKYIYK